MKARLLPIYFQSERDAEFDAQLEILRDLFAEEAEFLEPAALGTSIPEVDAVVFPQLVGEAYRGIEKLKEMDVPLVVITSEFGTVAMWDWEIVTFLKSHGLKVFAPYTLELTKVICRALALKREMKQARFLAFQDNPGNGFQGYIFKRFYWWEDACIQRFKEKFGISIEKRSFKKLAGDAKLVSDAEADAALERWKLSSDGVCPKALRSAAKLYLAVDREIGGDAAVKGVGINCPNESMFTDTTPCLAWNMLFEEKGLLWACEADMMSLLTEYVVNKSLNAPVMMSNVYPFLIGMAALKHEKITEFPQVAEPENHILVAHCGYFGFVPRCFAQAWTLRPRVLEIVDENAMAVDARLPVGKITLTKLHPSLNKIQVIEGELEEYVQYPGSDCRNGALIKIKDGRRLVNDLYSHHSCFSTGHIGAELEMAARVLGLEAEML